MNNKIVTEERRWFTMLPNIVDDMGLDPYAFRLYLHLRRVAGEQGACWQSTNTLARHCKMSDGSVSSSKKTLAEMGLILIETKTAKATRYHHITIIDIWAKNINAYSSKSGARSLCESAGSPCELAGSPCETKKNPIKKNPEPARDFLGDIVEHTKKKEQEEWKEELPRGWDTGEVTENEWRTCMRVAILWTDGKLAHFANDIERSLAAANYLLDLHNDDLRATMLTIDSHHAETENDGLTIAGPYSLRNVIPAFMAANGIGQNKRPMKVGR